MIHSLVSAGHARQGLVIIFDSRLHLVCPRGNLFDFVTTNESFARLEGSRPFHFVGIQISKQIVPVTGPTLKFLPF